MKGVRISKGCRSDFFYLRDAVGFQYRPINAIHGGSAHQTRAEQFIHWFAPILLSSNSSALGLINDDIHLQARLPNRLQFVDPP